MLRNNFCRFQPLWTSKSPSSRFYPPAFHHRFAPWKKIQDTSNWPRRCRAVLRLLAIDLHVATSWINCHLDSTEAPRPDLGNSRSIPRPERTRRTDRVVSFRFQLVKFRYKCHNESKGDAVAKVMKRKVKISWESYEVGNHRKQNVNSTRVISSETDPNKRFHTPTSRRNLTKNLGPNSAKMSGNSKSISVKIQWKKESHRVPSFAFRFSGSEKVQVNLLLQ